MYDVENYAFPSIVLGKDGKIIAKNKAAAVSCPFFRKGCGIKSQVSLLEYAAIFMLKSGESMSVSLNCGVDAVIFFDGESYLLRTNVLGVNVRKELSYLCDIREKGLKYFEFPSFISNKTLLRHSFFIQKCMNEYIKYIMTPSSVPHIMVDLSVTLRDMINACAEKLKCTRLSVSPERLDRSCFVIASKSHIEYMVMMSLALLFCLSKSLHVAVNQLYTFDRVCLSFRTDTDADKRTVSSIAKALNTGELCDEKNELFFYAMYIRTITELYAGNVYMEHDTSSGRLEIRITFPAVKDDTITFENEIPILAEYAELAETVYYTLVEGFELGGEPR